MSDSNLYYRHSGRFSPIAAVAMLAMGVLGGGVLGAAYGIGIWYSPIIYLNLLGTAAAGGAAGWVIGWIGKQTHARSAPLALACGAVGGLAMVYTSWVGWVLAASGWEGTVLTPAHLWVLMVEVGQEGVWSIGRSSEEPVRGAVLYGVWAIEAGMLLAVPAWVASYKIAGTPYCEVSGRWLDKAQPLGPLEPITQPEVWKQKLEQGDFGILGSLKAVPEDSDMCTFYDLRASERPDGLHLLSVRIARTVINKKGEAEVQNAYLVRNMKIDSECHELIRQIASEPMDEDIPASPTEDPAAATEERGDAPPNPSA